MNNLDLTLALRFRETTDNGSFDQMPLYLLRKRALYCALAPGELGRVFFHLSQRRGFKSNRKEVKKNAKENQELLSAYRSLWLTAMFDLPVETPTNKRDYTRFRKALLKDGFMILQFSIYARYLPSEEAADSHRKYDSGSYSAALACSIDDGDRSSVRQNGSLLWKETTRT